MIYMNMLKLSNVLNGILKKRIKVICQILDKMEIFQSRIFFHESNMATDYLANYKIEQAECDVPIFMRISPQKGLVYYLTLVDQGVDEGVILAVTHGFTYYFYMILW